MEKKNALSVKAKEYILTEDNAAAVLIFILSRVHVYADVVPLGLSAVLASGKAFSPVAILSFVMGTGTAAMGFTAYLRHIFSFIFILSVKKIFKDRIKDELVLLLCVFAGGMLSLALRPFSGFAVAAVSAEALMSAAACILYKRAFKVLFAPTLSALSEKDSAAFFCLFLTLSLGFMYLPTGRLSVTSAMLIFWGMAAAYKNTPSVSALINIGAGFGFYVFSPENPAAVSLFAMSGFLGSYLRKFGKAAIPVSYIIMLPLFFGFSLERAPFSVYDIASASILFMLMPHRLFDRINVVTSHERDEGNYLCVADKMTELSDMFSEIADSFEAVGPKKADNRLYAAEEAEKKICADCLFSSICRIDAKRRLFDFAKKAPQALSESEAPEEIKKYCRRKKELMTEFSKNYQLARMETLWQKRLSEETEALSGQMRCVSGIFSGLSEEEAAFMKRDNAAEECLRAALLRQGIAVKRIRVGKTARGVTEVKIASKPCKGNGMCDSVIKTAVEKALGFETERIGIKNCAHCSFAYAGTAPYVINAVKLSVPFEKVCGDSAAFARIDSERYAIALSDGMGTGKSAAEESRIAAHTALRLLSAGTSLETTAKMINSLLINKSGGKSFATLDIAVINLFSGEAEYLKNGAAAGYIFTSGGRVKTVGGNGSPLGAVGNCETMVKKLRLYDGDMLILVSDGISDSFGEDGERKISEALSEFTAGSIEEISEFLARKAISAVKGKLRDDMTVITVGCIKRKKGGNNTEKKEA